MNELIKRWSTYVVIFVAGILLTLQYQQYMQHLEFEAVRKDIAQQQQQYEKQIIVQAKHQHVKKVNQQKNCIKNALYYEARSEGKLGILAVASVIENRKNSARYPDDYCSVINQRKQFSYTLEGKPDVKAIEGRLNGLNKVAYRQVSEVADKMVEGRFEPLLPSNVLHYATVKINNAWTKTKKVYATIGNHHFYKEKSNETTRTR